MSSDSLKEANVAKALDAFVNFNPLEQSWCDGLHDDIVMEFPFGADVGLPARVEGKAMCQGLFQAVVQKLNLSFSDVRVDAMDDPNFVIAQYKGAGSFDGKPYNQLYITLMEYRDGKLILYREFVDTKIVADVFGHMSALM